MKVWLTVQRFSYKFSILYFSEFSLTDDNYQIARYRRQKANPLISKKPTDCRPPDLSRTFFV